MAVERPENFRMSLDKMLKTLNLEDDTLKTEKECVAEEKKLKALNYSHLIPEQTENIYQVAQKSNMLATFEKLKREVMDIYFTNIMQERGTEFRDIPVFSYNIRCCEMRQNNETEQEIRFVTKAKEFGKLNIFLTLKEHKSILPGAASVKSIQISIGKKIPDSLKVREAFHNLLNSSGLLLDFIVDSLWPAITALKKAEQAELQEKHKKELEEKVAAADPTILPTVSRSFSGGNNRAASKPFTQRNENHNGGPKERTMERKNGGRDNRNKGDPIPRCNPQKSPRSQPTHFGSFNGINHPTHSSDARRTVGGSFGPRKDSSSRNVVHSANNGAELLQNCQQSSRNEPVKSGRKKNGRRNNNGSDNTNWRKDKENS